MANWEYKVLSSGKHGMATMAALEQYLNDLGQQQWEIINWQTAPDNVLLFAGLARRPIMRDWKPDEMPAAQAAAVRVEKTEDEKERDAWRDTLKEELEFFSEKENEDDDAEADTEDLLDILRPMMKRSLRGPGAIGAVNFLARRLEQSEEDLLGALAEAGVVMPQDPQMLGAALEHEGEFYWLNKNPRGEVWLNCGPKAPVQKAPPAPRAERPQPAPRQIQPRAEAAAPAETIPAEAAPERPPAPPAAPAPAASTGSLPEGAALVEKLRPMMRRNRRGRGWSGSTSFLSRALRQSEADLQAALAKLGLILGDDPLGKPVFVEINGYVYWLNRGQGGQIWINAREQRAGEAAEPLGQESDSGEVSAAPPSEPTAPAPAGETTPVESAAPAAEISVESSPADVSPVAPAPAPSPLVPAAIWATIRPHFTKNKRGTAFSAAPGRLAEALGIAQADLIESLVRAGLSVPTSEDEKPVFAESEGEIFWFNRNAQDELWLNAKAKPARKAPVRSGAARPAARKKKSEAPE